MQFLNQHFYAAIALTLSLGFAGGCEVISDSEPVDQPRRENRQASEATPHNPNVLVTAEWLKQQLEFDAVRLIELTHRETQYQIAHIPKASFVNWRSDIIDEQQSDRYKLPSKEKMESLLSRLGITPNTTVVLSDNLENRLAVRMYFTMKYFGHDDVRILDGGTKAYERAGFDLTDKVTEYPASDYNIETVREDYVIKMDAVEDIVQTKSAHVIDGRPVMQYTGEKKGRVFHTREAHERVGHISGASSIPWTLNLNDDGTFKTVEELEKLYAQHGIDRDDAAVSYCNEGLHATFPWFVLHEILGNEQIRVYDDSLSEWANLTGEDAPPMTQGMKR